LEYLSSETKLEASFLNSSYSHP